MWIDSHCHLSDPKIDFDTAIEAQGVEHLVNIACEAKDWDKACEVAAKYANISASIGVHPHNASEGVANLVDYLEKPGVVAVGECGLDYHYDNSPRDIQREVFAQQIRIAHEHELPLVIHTRSAWDETFEVLGSEGWPTNTVIHCFTGGTTEAKKCLEQGAHISFSGIVTFPSAADDVATAAKIVPDERILIETDSPYLAPVPHRGETNVPARVAVVGEFIAGLRGQPTQEFAELTTKNAKAFFGLT